MTSQFSSGVWNYFRISDNENVANCNLCPAKISRGGGTHSTSGLWKHLRNKHPTKFRILEGKGATSQLSVPASSSLSVEVSSPSSSNSNESHLDDPTSILNSDVGTFSPDTITLSRGEQSSFKAPPTKRKTSIHQPALKSFVDKMQNFKPGDRRAAIITRLIAEMICKDNQPFSIVEDKGFRKLINHLEPRYTMPSRKYLANKIIPNMYEEAKEKVEKLVGETDFMGITTDAWTSTASDDYLCLTIHFLDKSFEYHHLCLECIPFEEVSHSAAAIQTFVAKTIEECDCARKVVCIVTDNESSMVAAMERTPFNHVPCLAHTFQLVIEDGLLNKTDIKDLISTCRKIVGHFQHSPEATRVLRTAQEKLNLKPHRLIRDEPTRWNSQLHMLSRLMEQRQAVTLAASTLKFQLDLSSRQWTTIEEIIKILDVFDRATHVAITSEVTISETIPLVNSTVCTLRSFKLILSSLQDVCRDLIESLKERYESVEEQQLYSFATILDPRFKGSVFQCKDNLARAKLLLIDEINSTLRPVNDENPAQTKEKSVEVEEQKIHGMWGFYSQLMTSNSTCERRNSCQTPEEEIDNYLREPLLPPSASIFRFWKNDIKYPNLKKLSKKYLVTPPSTVHSERVFSTSDIIVDNKRSRLDPDRVRMLVFLNKNLN